MSIYIKSVLYATIGAMIFVVAAFLPGCGSDNTPGGSAKGKNTKPAAIAQGVKSQAPSALLIDKEGTVSGKLKKHPDYKLIEVVPQMSREEVEAKIAANRALHDPKLMEPYPGAGITQEQLQAKIAANQALHNPKLMEPYPGAGITQEQLQAKIAANQALHDPKLMEPYPGAQLTQEQLQAKITANQALHDPKLMGGIPKSK
jgi:hypothetical protein